jgi:dihydropteroate synthase
LDIEAGRPLLMGIVNASPDSFSDGALARRGRESQFEQALALAEDGAAIIDVGGESAVTNQPPVDPAEEIRRVVPLVERLTAQGVLVSVDTYKPMVARAAIAAGAALINDVSGLRDPALAEICAVSGAGLVVMHTCAAPKQKIFPAYADVVGDVVTFLHDRLQTALERGMTLEQLVVDPGPDFAKTPADTVTVLRAVPRLDAVLARPVLLAVSRKDFIGALTSRPPRGRLAGTLAAVGAAVSAGAAILRVHDVAAVADFLRVRAALAGELEMDPELRLPLELRHEPA